MPTIIPSSALGRERVVAANERIQLGVIGLGSRGFNLLEEFLQLGDCRILAVCDVDELHYRDLAWGKGKAYGRQPARELIEKHYATAGAGVAAGKLDVYRDFREVCARDDLDAIVVATPDHWHALCTLEALRHGKDVYCEKPVTHLFAEGQQVYREVAQRQAVFQTGSQQRSEEVFRRAVEIVRNGHLGPIQRLEIGLPGGYEKPQGDATVVAPPETLDYEMWCGPSPVLPYMRARHHRWWRGHRDYGGGTIMDWIGHHNDIAHWALDMDQSGPTRVEAVGWKFPNTDVYNTPQDYEIVCEYQGGITTSIADRHPIGTRFIGADGWLRVFRTGLEASDPRWIRPDFPRGEKTVFASPGHTRNFLDSVRSRQPCVAPAETGHRSITPGHLGYVSHELGRALRWDPVAERTLDDEEAQTLLTRIEYRSPWNTRS